MEKKSAITAVSRWQKARALILGNPLKAALAFLIVIWFFVAAIVDFVEHEVTGHNIENFGDALWWGLVTLSTVGYGDKYPVSPLGRLAASLLILSGLVAIAIVTAKISSFFLERALRERRGIVDPSTLHNHFVICGWKDEMADFLIHFLDGNPSIKAAQIVLVTAAPDSDIDHLHEIDRLRALKVIRGEHFLEHFLRRAAPDKARKVLILADATPSADGHIPTITEADARTIMTAMVLNNIARGVQVAAELIDASMEPYLRLAHVNEIIFSREHSRLLLALASGGVGVINVYHDLLSPKSSSFLTTKPVPEEFSGTTFAELREYIQNSNRHETIIGLLENSGNSYVAKESALARAQQTPNIGELVKNLQSVKALRFNEPHFNPKLDFPINQGTMMIVIEERSGDQAINA